MKNFKRRFLWLLGLLVLGALVWGVAEHHRRKWRLEAYKVELVKQGVEFDLAKLIPPVPPEEENGASLLSAGAAQLNEPIQIEQVAKQMRLFGYLSILVRVDC